MSDKEQQLINLFEKYKKDLDGGIQPQGLFMNM